MSLNHIRLSPNKSLCWIDQLPSIDTQAEATLIVLFDVSASMGIYVEHFWRALTSAICDSNYTRVEIITFGHQATRFTTTLRTLATGPVLIRRIAPRCPRRLKWSSTL